MIKYDFLYVLALTVLLASCKATSKVSVTSPGPVSKNALLALEDSLSGAHLGVMVTEAETGNILAEYNSHKYFVPASNTKLLSLYAGLKYLGDSLVGLRYYDAGDTVYAMPTGDPTLLMNEYKAHPVYDWLSNMNKPVVFDASNWKAERYGRGWTWSDFQASYQPERNALPVYGNLMPIRFSVKGDSVTNNGQKSRMVAPLLEMGESGWTLPAESVTYSFTPQARFNRINRNYAGNSFEVSYNGRDTAFTTEIPFVTYGLKTGLEMLMAHLKRPESELIVQSPSKPQTSNPKLQTIKTQPLDSMLRPMMHRSDNFYAEQTVLMASNEFLGYMSDRDMIDTMMKTDFKGMPDKPVWADGSGLSRYNLFSPADFVWLLNKIRNEFGMDRIKGIMQSGNTGTLNNYYKALSGKIYAKTGTLSGQVGLSGYLYAKSGKLLLFSVLVNNHNTDGPKVRRQVERYLTAIWEAN